ncbi:MAG: type VI secretion system accessory protein TagJ [Gemmataceae bacterium]
MSNSSPQMLYRSGQLSEAILAATNEVRAKPTDVPARLFLGELLLFAGELERADRQLDVISSQGCDPQMGLAIAMYRQLIRAEQARQAFFTEGAMPEFLDAPDERMKLVLRASIALREQQYSEARDLLTQAESHYPALRGRCNGVAFEGIRDTDDLTATFFEVVAPNGKYFWLPMEHVVSIEFKPPQRARDLVWRRGKLTTRNGLETEAFFPAIYAGSFRESEPKLALGQLTDWRVEAEGAPVRGMGQRTLLVGDDGQAFWDLQTLIIDI